MQNRILSILGVTTVISVTLAAQPQRPAAPPNAEQLAEQKRADELTEFIKANYTKYEYQIPMRDGSPPVHRGVRAEGLQR